MIKQAIWAMLGLLLLTLVGSKAAGTESRLEGGRSPARPTEETAQAIWAGESGGFKIRWTEVDIQAHPLKSPNRVVISARSLAKIEFARFAAAEKQYGLKARYREVVRSFEILSVVGSIMSFLEGTGIDCEETAHPSSTNRFVAIDLKKPGDAGLARDLEMAGALRP